MARNQSICNAASVCLLLAACVTANAGSAPTLESFAKGKVLPVHTVTEGSRAPLAPGDQSNNFKLKAHVLSLSGKGLTSLEGISRLRVQVDGKEKSLSEVEELHLFLNNNQLHSLPAELFAMQNVAWLYMYYNKLDAIPPQIAQMKGLNGIYVTGNNITRIPPEVFTMTWLRKLQVSNNHLTEIPAAIGNLTELMHLNLSSNAIEVVPESMGRLKKLRVCDLSDNRIQRLPDSFGHVPIMHQLRVRNNPLTALPSGFEKCPCSVDVYGTNIDLDTLTPAMRAQIGSEKRNPSPKPNYK